MILFMIFTLGLTSMADSAELDRVGMQVGHFYNKHDLFIPEFTDYEMDPVLRSKDVLNETWAYELRLFMDVTLAQTRFGETYWNNNIIGGTTNHQFRYVSWDFELGQKLTDQVSIFYHHQSEHALEMYREDFPMHDVMGLRFCFGGRDCE